MSSLDVPFAEQVVIPPRGRSDLPFLPEAARNWVRNGEFISVQEWYDTLSYRDFCTVLTASSAGGRGFTHVSPFMVKTSPPDVCVNWKWQGVVKAAVKKGFGAPAEEPLDNWDNLPHNVSLSHVPIAIDSRILGAAHDFWDVYTKRSLEWQAMHISIDIDRTSEEWTKKWPAELPDLPHELPDEIWVHVFKSAPDWCPLSVFRVSRVCKRFYGILKNIRDGLRITFPPAVVTDPINDLFNYDSESADEQDSDSDDDVFDDVLQSDLSTPPRPLTVGPTWKCLAPPGLPFTWDEDMWGRVEDQNPHAPIFYLEHIAKVWQRVLPGQKVLPLESFDTSRFVYKGEQYWNQKLYIVPSRDQLGRDLLDKYHTIKRSYNIVGDGRGVGELCFHPELFKKAIKFGNIFHDIENMPGLVMRVNSLIKMINLTAHLFHNREPPARPGHFNKVSFEKSFDSPIMYKPSTTIPAYHIGQGVQYTPLRGVTNVQVTITAPLPSCFFFPNLFLMLESVFVKLPQFHLNTLRVKGEGLRLKAIDFQLYFVYQQDHLQQLAPQFPEEKFAKPSEKGLGDLLVEVGGNFMRILESRISSVMNTGIPRLDEREMPERVGLKLYFRKGPNSFENHFVMEEENVMKYFAASRRAGN